MNASGSIDRLSSTQHRAVCELIMGNLSPNAAQVCLDHIKRIKLVVPMWMYQRLQEISAKAVVSPLSETATESVNKTAYAPLEQDKDSYIGKVEFTSNAGFPARGKCPVCGVETPGNRFCIPCGEALDKKAEDEDIPF